jgi:putative sigma-54 modulation protein
VTVNYFNHQLVGLGSSADLFTAIHSAAEKLEKQAVKARTKWRDTKRAPNKPAVLDPVSPKEPEEAPPSTRVYRVNQHQKRKPMTLEEAMLEMDRTRDYLVYRDAETDRVSVLLRRRDGNFDLVEG